MPKLFSPIKLGPYTISHRVVLAPLTRMRANLPGNVPNALMEKYYGQRASEGGFMLTEATFISPTAYGSYGSPGIFTDAQVTGWRLITQAVHAKGAKIFLQLWHVGRASHVDLQPGGAAPLAPSAIQSAARALLANGPVQASKPRAILLDEIPGIVEEYRIAAANAKAAGFDGVEIHAANGYLIDQFLQDNANHRTDAYGGPVENRARFMLEVVTAVVSIWGDDRVGIRIGPSNSFGDMADSDPDATFAYVARALTPFDLAYLHIIEPRVISSFAEEGKTPVAAAKLKPLFGGTVIVAGGFDGSGAEAILQAGHADFVAFGRNFLANPDLPERLRLGLSLNEYDRNTFYYGGEIGYADYPFYDQTGFSTRATAV